MRYLIGVDIGTSGTKTVLFDENGNTLSSKTIEYPLLQPKNGWAEQDPKFWYDAKSKAAVLTSGEEWQSGRDAEKEALSAMQLVTSPFVKIFG